MLGRRRVVSFVALLVGAPLLAACDPPAPPPVFTVESDAISSDVDPGDGTCADGDGNCTLPAAIDEANALGSAEIVLPADRSVAGVDAEITGAVTIRGEASEVHAGVSLPGTVLRVAPDGVLALFGIDLDDGGLLVQGGLLADRIAFGHLTVQSGGTALVRNAFGVTPFAFPLIDNAGVLHVQSSTLLALNHTDPAIATAAGGVTRLRSTLVVDDAGSACTGTTPSSEGYNASDDATCGLTAVGDQPSADLTANDFFPEPGSPLLDAVPVGEAGCGTEVAQDILTNPRPVDGDDDGTSACDIGAYEHG